MRGHHSAERLRKACHVADPGPQAETLALRVVDFLARTDDLLEVFLASSGLAAEDLRRRLDDPDILAAALDFVLLDDDWVVAFAGEAGVDPAEVAAARRALPGGELPHWT